MARFAHLASRLKQEAEQILEKVAREGAGIGSAEVVQFEASYAEKMGIGMFGRMVISNGTPQYYAAPRDLDRKPMYEAERRDLFGPVRNFLGGGQADWSMLDRPISGLRLAKAPTDWDSGTYEERLIGMLLTTSEVTLINPSFKALAAAKRAYTNRTVHVVVPKADEVWAEDVIDFVQKSRGALVVVDEPVGISYLGESLPAYYPTSWIRFIPCPYSVGNRALYKMDEGGMVLMNDIKGRPVVNHLSKQSLFTYCPEQVDKALLQDKLRFYIESSQALTMPNVNIIEVFHKPFFINKGKKEERKKMFCQGVWVTLLGDEVIDIDVAQTYLSKRSTWTPPSGKKWTPILEQGSHYFSFSSISPVPVLGASFQDGKVVYGHGDLAVVVKQEEKKDDPVSQYKEVTTEEVTKMKYESFGISSKENRVVSLRSRRDDRGLLVVVPEEVNVVFSTTADLFVYYPRNIDPAGFLPCEKSTWEEGTLYTSSTYSHLTLPTRKILSWNDTGWTALSAATHLEIRRSEALRVVCQPGWLLWKYDVKEPEYVKVSDCLVPICCRVRYKSEMGGSEQIVQIEVKTIEELWSHIRRPVFELVFPDKTACFPEPLLSLVRANGYAVSRSNNLEGRTYRARNLYKS